MKKLLLLFLLSSVLISAQQFPIERATGLFMSVGVGPRIPIGDFSKSQSLGIGFNVTFSYTDVDFLPLFLYSKIGYQHYAGKQSFYQNSEYSSFSSNVILLNGGVRYYLPPIIEDMLILMPVAEAGATIAYFEKLHQFKVDLNKNDFTEDTFKLGFHIGAGVSMFMMDVMGYYYYMYGNQFLSINLRVRIPIFVTF